MAKPRVLSETEKGEKCRLELVALESKRTELQLDLDETSRRIATVKNKWRAVSRAHRPWTQAGKEIDRCASRESKQDWTDF